MTPSGPVDRVISSRSSRSNPEEGRSLLAPSTGPNTPATLDPNTPATDTEDSPKTGISSWSSAIINRGQRSLRRYLPGDQHDPNDSDWDKWLRPLWVRHEAFIEKFKQEQTKNNGLRKLTTFHVSGPALNEIFMSSALLWVVALAMPFFSYFHCFECPDLTKNQPFGHYKEIVWVPFIPVWCFAMWKEFLAFKMTILPYCQMFVQPDKERFFKAIGLKISCIKYMMVIFPLSAVSKLDLATNGLTLSKVWMTYNCKTNSDPNMVPWFIWDRLIQESSVCRIPQLHRLGWTITLGWALMFVQAIYAILHVIPWERQRAEKIDYGWASEGKGYHTLGQAIGSCICRKPVNDVDLARHADCLRILGFSSRMISLVDKSLEWTLARAMELAAEGSTAGTEHATAMLKKEADRSSKRVWIFTLFERGLMLQVQVTLFCVSRHILKAHAKGMDSFDGEMLFSMCISYTTYAKAFFDHITQVLAFSRCLHELEQRGDLSETSRGHLQRVRIDIGVFVLGIFLALALLIHCLCKSIGSFSCESALWNNPINAGPHVGKFGCVSGKIFTHSNLTQGYQCID